MRRAEVEWAEVPYPETLQAHATPLSSDDDHGAHVFLYVPDASVETGWSTHRVPDRQPERAERREMGFRR